VIWKASGVPYAKFVQDNIFTPLSMKDSGYESDAVLARRASGYARKDGMIVNASYIDMSAVTAAGAFYSTTHDLLIWEKALLGGKLLSQASLKKMTRPFKDAWGPGAPFKGGYAMGLYVGTTLDGRREISHTGDISGFVSMMAAYPDDKLIVIVLSNIGTAPSGNVASNVADVALGKAVILLNETLFASLDHAREALDDWKDDYNTVRPHSAIGNVPPAVYANLSDPEMQRVGSLDLPWGSAPHPVASPSQQGSKAGKLYLPAIQRWVSDHQLTSV